MDKALEAGVQMFRKACPQINGAVSDTTLNVAFGLAVRAVIDALAEDEETVERVARAMQQQSRPFADPDKMQPAPRGQLGEQPLWKLWEPQARAALAAIKGE
jgi:hypothetical protein